MKSVGDKERHDHDIARLRQFPPIGNERRFFHVNVQHFREFSQRTNLFCFAFCRHGAVLVQIGSMRDDEQAGLDRIDSGCDLVCALE